MIRASIRRRLVVIAEGVFPHFDRRHRLRPDRSGRIDGRTQPRSALPSGIGARIGERLRTLPELLAALLSGSAIEVLRPRKDDVIVVRSGYLASLQGADLAAELARVLAAQGVILVVLPEDCRVHAEPRAKPAEDLGYRETRNVSVDAGTLSGETIDAGEAGKQVCGAERGSG